MWSRDGAKRTRRLELVTKTIRGRLHAIARMEAPASVRGMALRIVENLGKADDTWVYLPSQRRARRISSQRRNDSFLGSDLTYADFERKRAADFEVLGVHAAELGGEAVWRIETRPRMSSPYDRIDHWVSGSDAATLRTDDYQSGGQVLVRVLRTPRSGIHAEGPWRVPERIEVEHRKRHTRTEVVSLRLEIAPDLPDAAFARNALSRGR